MLVLIAILLVVLVTRPGRTSGKGSGGAAISKRPIGLLRQRNRTDRDGDRHSRDDRLRHRPCPSIRQRGEERQSVRRCSELRPTLRRHPRRKLHPARSYERGSSAERDRHPDPCSGSIVRGVSTGGCSVPPIRRSTWSLCSCTCSTARSGDTRQACRLSGRAPVNRLSRRLRYSRRRGRRCGRRASPQPGAPASARWPERHRPGPRPSLRR